MSQALDQAKMLSEILGKTQTVKANAPNGYEPQYGLSRKSTNGTYESIDYARSLMVEKEYTLRLTNKNIEEARTWFERACNENDNSGRFNAFEVLDALCYFHNHRDSVEDKERPGL